MTRRVPWNLKVRPGLSRQSHYPVAEEGLERKPLSAPERALVGNLLATSGAQDQSRRRKLAEDPEILGVGTMTGVRIRADGLVSMVLEPTDEPGSSP